MNAEIHLIGMGTGPGTPAHEIVPGDRLMWNFGYVSEVLTIVPCGKESLNMALRSQKGEVSIRRIRKNTLVARCRS